VREEFVLGALRIAAHLQHVLTLSSWILHKRFILFCYSFS